MSWQAVQWVFEHSKARGASRLVELALASHARDDGTSAYPSAARLAREANLSERAVRAALATLRQDGAIEDAGEGPRRTREYRVAMAVGGPHKGANRAGVQTVQGADGAGRRVQSVPEEGAQSAPEPSVEPSSEPSTPPQPPRGGRRRDHQRHNEDFTTWANKHFPDTDPGYIRHAIEVVTSRGQELTPANLRPEVHRWSTSTAEGA